MPWWWQGDSTIYCKNSNNDFIVLQLKEHFSVLLRILHKFKHEIEIKPLVDGNILIMVARLVRICGGITEWKTKLNKINHHLKKKKHNRSYLCTIKLVQFWSAKANDVNQAPLSVHIGSAQPKNEHPNKM